MKKKQAVEQEQEQQPKKKHGLRNGIIIAAVIIVLAAIISNTGNKDATEVDTATAEPTTVTTGYIKDSVYTAEDGTYTLPQGEVVTANINGFDGILVLEAKVSASVDDERTIMKNYQNAVDLVENQGAAEFNELQYWAIADTLDGDETKIISLTCGFYLRS